MALKLKCNNCNIVVNELLSFVQNKIDVMNNVSLALICRQSFSEEDIREAKCLLFESVPQRKVKRKGDEKSKRNIEDIIGILRGTDPDDIPVYVARELHKLPPVSFDHVDVTRLLKDLLLVQNELKLIKQNVNSDNFVTKEEFQKEIMKLNCRTECGNDSVVSFVTEPYVNMNRGGYRAQDSSECSSGPNSPSMTMQNQVSAVSPSYASVTASATTIPVSVAPVTETASEPVRAATASEAKEPRASTLTSCRSAEKTMSRNTEADGSAAVAAQDKEDGDWIRVGRRQSRFKGMKGTAAVDSAVKLKAADIPIPLIIYNVSKETTEMDVAEYVYDKTRVTIFPEILSNLKADKSYASFKFDVPRSKLTMFTSKELWPEGIFFRRFILFRKERKTIGRDNKNK